MLGTLYSWIVVSVSSKGDVFKGDQKCGMKTRLNANFEIAIVLELKTPHNFTKYTTLLKLYLIGYH